MKTGFNTNGKDLADIFQRRKKDDPKAANTGFSVDGIDLAEIFLPYSGGAKAEPVGYSSFGQDLSEIFDPK